MFAGSDKTTMPTAETALVGRDEIMEVTNQHFINGNPIQAPFPEHLETALFGLGCFWGVERKFWQVEGVYSTAVGYAGGFTKNPTYKEVCTGQTGHNEVALIVFDPSIVSYKELLKLFWESHDPTQGMRQGNDVGTQYRSGIYTYSEEQQQQAIASKESYQASLQEQGYAEVTTEILPAPTFYYAEDYHQQYLAKNPAGYCGIGGTGVSCII